MKAITADLSSELDELEIHTFADTHIGDENCDIELVKSRIEYVKNTENAYCLLNGDILDVATRLSIGDIETRSLNIMQQIQTGFDLFDPIKHKILAISSGNHESRVYNKEGVDISKIIALELGLADKYTSDAAVLFIRFGWDNHHKRKMCYTLYLTHGRGGGRKEGAKAIRLADMASIIDCDVYCHGHSHLPLVMKQGFIRVDRQNSSFANVTKLFVNNAACLDYGGYGVVGEFKPASKDTPVIYLDGHKKNATAKL